MLSVNKNDCLACAIAEAKGISYKSAYYSTRTAGTVFAQNAKEVVGMPRMSTVRAIFSRKSMVLVFLVTDEDAHAVAVVNGKCIDNVENSKICGKSVWWLLCHRKVIGVFKASNSTEIREVK